MAFSSSDFEEFQQKIMALNTDNQNDSLIDLESDNNKFTQKQNTNPERSGESQMLTQFMEMMKIVEENRKASEDKLLALLSTQPQRNETLYRVMPDFSQTIENFDGEALGEKAMDWLASLESAAILHSWPQEILLETAKVHLVGTARKCQIGTSYGKKMRKRHQGRNESIFSYFHDKVTLCKALDYDFVETKEQVLVGLYNKQIIPGLVAARAENLDELLHEIVDFDRITGKAQNTQQGNMQKFVNRSNPVSNGRINLVKNTNVKEEFTIRKEDKNIDTADKYLRDIDINGKKVKALIDPGSAVCTIKEDIVRENKLMCEPTNEKLYGFGEGSTICKWQTKLKVKIDNVEADVVALVVPDLVQPTDVLLGRSFTDIPTVAYVKIGNALYFGQEDEPPFCNLEWGDIPNKKTITVGSSVTLLKNQINLIQVQGDNDERWLPVMNISKDVVSLEKGQKLGGI
ncbi:hypothetical protein NQ314_001534 [Rhamnusium bicolor]|uniref:Peptidase A2 domain-containing protein n=1 Tax=Rhamnusium bicolor TaxID=1586634 RepID=A0AAV8ZV52_9CUCU|nr:hypothetical protein NQ314_001534 [Rhamnusium bicolor]